MAYISIDLKTGKTIEYQDPGREDILIKNALGGGYKRSDFEVRYISREDFAKLPDQVAAAKHRARAIKIHREAHYKATAEAEKSLEQKGQL